MPQFLRLIYLSERKVTQQIDREIDFGTLLHRSRANNERDNITGCLLYSDRCFAQVLEGRRDEILNTFSRIEADTRHVRVCILQSKTVQSRLFEQWSLLFQKSNFDRIEQVSGLGYRLLIEQNDLGRETLLDILTATVASETRRLDLKQRVVGAVATCVEIA